MMVLDLVFSMSLNHWNDVHPDELKDQKKMVHWKTTRWQCPPKPSEINKNKCLINFFKVVREREKPMGEWQQTWQKFMMPGKDISPRDQHCLWLWVTTAWSESMRLPFSLSRSGMKCSFMIFQLRHLRLWTHRMMTSWVDLILPFSKH